MDLAVPFVGLGPESRRRNRSESMELLRYLLDNGADINARLFAHNHYNRDAYFDPGSALNLALMNGEYEKAEELLDRGARTDVAAGEYLEYATALELATKYKVPPPHLLSKLEEIRRREIASGAP
ncbi:hypothetical protein ColLi_07607 [Colletotrichum liriopes]|uniref:Ankyrin repeat domain-containing protein n=1 Tax=Colletotrichum liriopes TaxID=708192 RepID=A0AA37GQ50_9PEZI|nr:hypothetical protein ColLi_07607 [Colletotrichum liriopes]